MIVPMSRLRCVGPKSLLRQTVDLLHTEGVVHIESAPALGGASPLARLAADDAIEREHVDLDRLRAQVTRCLLLLPERPDAERAGAAHPSGEAVTESNRARLAAVTRRLDQLTRRRKLVEDELSLLSRYGRVMEALAPLVRRLPVSRDLASIGITLERADPETLGRVREALGRLTDDRFELLTAEVDPTLTAGMLVVPASLGPRIRAALGEEGLGEMPVPASLADKPWGRAVAVVLNRRVRLPAALARLDAALQSLSWHRRSWLEALDRALANRLSQIEAMAWFYQTELTFLIDGWAPRDAVAGLRERLRRETGGRVVVDTTETLPSDSARVPVALSNARWMAPFERLVHLISLPRYGTIDPTPFLAVGFPFFFGMIVGDVAYGVILLAALGWVRQRWPRHPVAGPAVRIGVWACAWTIVFGVLYGECFGTLGERWGIAPLLVDRLHAFPVMLAATAGVGVLHVGLSIGLGIATAVRAGRRSDVLSKLGGLCILLGAVALIAGAFRVIPAWTRWPAAGAAGLGVLLLAASREAKAFMELHNLVNVLSYLRLMGIGVASAALALAANLLGAMSGHVLAAVAIGALVHGLNLVFAVVSPSIQALRLHYVEFFENFFQSGGREYRPFRRVERHQ